MSSKVVEYEEMIPLDRVPDAVSAVDKARKKWKRNKFPGNPPSLEVLEDTRKREIVGKDFLGFPVYKQKVKVILRIDETVIKGWTVLAEIEHLKGGNIITQFSDIDGRKLAKYRKADSYCDHCGTNRRRKSTYILKKHRGRKLMQVGSTCLDEYTRKGAEKLISAVFGIIRQFGGFADEEGESYGSGRNLAVKTEAVIALAYMLTEAIGYTSRSKADAQGVLSTAEVIRDYYFGSASFASSIAKELSLSPDPQVRKAASYFKSKKHWNAAKLMARKIRTFVKGIKADSNYENNLKVLAGEQYCEYKHVGWVASMVPFYLREQEKKAKTQKRGKTRKAPDNAWVAEPGDKFGRKVTAADRRKGAKQYPAVQGEVVRDFKFTVSDPYTGLAMTVFGVEVHDEATNVIFSMTGAGVKDAQPKEGDTVRVEGTVKAHKEYKGKRSTQLSRPKITVIKRGKTKRAMARIEEIVDTTHQFRGQDSPVPAHKHPNGGGWVSNDSDVHPDVKVGKDAEVCGKSEIQLGYGNQGKIVIAGNMTVISSKIVPAVDPGEKVHIVLDAVDVGLVKYAEIRAGTTRIFESSVLYTTIAGSSVRVTDSVVNGGKLANCKVFDSEVSESEVSGVKIVESEVISSKVTGEAGTEIEDSTVVDSTVGFYVENVKAALRAVSALVTILSNVSRRDGRLYGGNWVFPPPPEKRTQADPDSEISAAQAKSLIEKARLKARLAREDAFRDEVVR